MIVHIDMDAFFASIEQAVNPRLKGRPLIVGSRPKRLYTVVCAASYEAKALGIDSGMPSKDAFRICPDLEFVAADQSKYIWTSEQILELLKAYGYCLNYASIDEFQLDIGQEPKPLVLAQDIQARIKETFHISASVGIARNCLLAKLASKLNKPNGITILNEDNLERVLAGTPAGKLCGVGSKTSQVLDGFGVRTCLHLYQKSPEFLGRILGEYGLNLYLGMHSSDTFNDSEEDQKPKSMGHSYTLPMATQNPGFIQAWIRLLSEKVGQRLRQAGLVSKTVHLWLNCPEIGNFNAQKTFQQGSADGEEIFARCLKIMTKSSPRDPKIRALGVTCSGLFPEVYPPLFKEQKRREALLKTLDKINSRYGEEAIFPAVITLTRKIPQHLTQDRSFHSSEHRCQA